MSETFYTIESYIRGIIPNVEISDNVMLGILIDADIAPETHISEISERERDLARAYLYIRIAGNPLTSQKVTEKDADWEHTSGSEQWSRAQLQQYLIQARILLRKWGVTDAALDSVVPKWGMAGNGFHAERKYDK